MFGVILSVGTVLLVTAAHAETLQEGATCHDGGVQGVCRKATSCPSYGVLARYHKDPEVVICSENGNEVVVCCTDCQIEESSKAAVTLDGIVWKTGGVRKSYDKCVEYAASLPYPCKSGKTLTPKKVYDAEKECHRLDVDVQEEEASALKRVDFPHLALLGYNATEPARWHCQGFLISERFIVSAAHCGRDHTNGPVSVVAVGVDRRPSLSAESPAGGQLHKVRRFIPHPEWRAPAKYNDIALLETDTEMKFSVNVLPLCLSELDAVPDTVQADVLGVAGVHDNEKVQIEKLDEKQCSALFTPTRVLRDGIDFHRQACYKGFNEHPELCLGSSGRPIYVSGELECMSYAVGVTSFGQTCRAGDASTVYSRLRHYLPWITSVVWP